MTRSGERTVEGTLPDPEQLMIEMEWLCGLARSLLGGEHGVDDLAQDASLAALAYPSGRGSVPGRIDAPRSFVSLQEEDR